MNRVETIKVITLLAGNYESFAKRTETDEQTKIIIDTWLECLGDLDYSLVLQSVKKTIIENPYPPTIHEIRKNAIAISNPVIEKTAIEAWNEALKMISKGGYMTQEEFEKASPQVKRFFGSVNQVKQLAMVDTETINTVTKGQFLKQYDVLIEREQERKMLPEQMQSYVGQLAKKMSIERLGGNVNEI